MFYCMDWILHSIRKYLSSLISALTSFQQHLPNILTYLNASALVSYISNIILHLCFCVWYFLYTVYTRLIYIVPKLHLLLFEGWTIFYYILLYVYSTVSVSIYLCLFKIVNVNNDTVSTNVQIVLSAIDFIYYWSVSGEIPSSHIISSLLFEDFIDHLAISLVNINFHSHTMHVYWYTFIYIIYA